MKTRVIFRKFRSDGGIVALFPDSPGFPVDSAACLSYEHVGQHGPAIPSVVFRITVPARPGEYRELAKELRQRGYKLEIRKRIPRNSVDLRELALNPIPIGAHLDLQNEAAELRYELSWVHKKLNLPALASVSEVQGALHVLCSDARGYKKYIEAYKCDDKQGEIARLTVERNYLLEEYAAIQGAADAALSVLDPEHNFVRLALQYAMQMPEERSARKPPAVPAQPRTRRLEITKP